MKVGYKDNFKAVRNVEDNLVYLLNVQIKETKDYSLIPQVKWKTFIGKKINIVAVPTVQNL